MDLTLTMADYTKSAHSDGKIIEAAFCRVNTNPLRDIGETGEVVVLKQYTRDENGIKQIVSQREYTLDTTVFRNIYHSSVDRFLEVKKENLPLTITLPI